MPDGLQRAFCRLYVIQNDACELRPLQQCHTPAVENTLIQMESSLKD